MSMKTGRRRCLAALLGFAAGVAALAAAAADDEITVNEAYQRSQAGEVLLIDVRTHEEWQQSGLPLGARPVTLNDPAGIDGFVAALRAAVGDDETRPIALICASGRRSARAKAALEEAGFTHVFNVKGGMFGSADAAGWAQQALPTEACKTC